MGLFDRFKKKGKEENYQAEQTEPDLDLNYSSGINAKIDFGDVIDYDGKHLQLVNVTYLSPNGEFRGKQCYMEPHIGTDEKGNRVYDTREYYKYLMDQGNVPLVKGFFKEEELDKIGGEIGANYIGYIDYDQRGNPTRSFDERFRSKYFHELMNKKHKEEARRTSEMQEIIKDLVNRAPEPHIKQDHAKILTREDYERAFGKHTQEER